MPGLIEAKRRRAAGDMTGVVVQPNRSELEYDSDHSMSELDRLLDEEDWELLNQLTEEELSILSAEFDPSNVDPFADRQPMFCQEDLLEQLEKAIEIATEVDTIKNEKLRIKEEHKKEERREQERKNDHMRRRTYTTFKDKEYDPVLDADLDQGFEDVDDLLSDDERELLEDCTDEDLIEIAAMLKMNGALTNDQITACNMGEKPQGYISKAWSVKAPFNPHMITKEDEETDLDVVKLMKCIKEDSDDLFYLCINNQPKLEKKILHEVFKRIGLSPKIRHVSLALAGINDDDIKILARNLRYNENLETLNLESNIISIRGIEPLMKSIQKLPNIREVKVSNQKNSLGAQGEEWMAKAIDYNENILKFGYSFMNPGARNKADRAILKHNEKMRQLKKQGGEIYDLKAECKKRDSFKCPWIVMKTRRLLSGLIEESVNTMGHMEGSEIVEEVKQVEKTAVKGKAKGSNAPEPPKARPLDVNALLAERKKRLAGGGGGVESLEKAQEEKQKQHLAEMQKKKDTSAMNGHPPPQPMMGGDLKSALSKGSKDMAKKTEKRLVDEEKVDPFANIPEAAPAVTPAAEAKEPEVDETDSVPKPTPQKEPEKEKAPTEKPKGKIVIPPVETDSRTPQRRRSKWKQEAEEEVDPFADSTPAKEPEKEKEKAPVETDSRIPQRRQSKWKQEDEEEVDPFADVVETTPEKEPEPEPEPKPKKLSLWFRAAAASTDSVFADRDEDDAPTQKMSLKQRRAMQKLSAVSAFASAIKR